MKIFLLGAFGFVGSHLSRKLHQLGHEVQTEMRYWSDRYDVIINLAAVTHIRNEFDPKMIESNIILTNEVFKRPERIIQASSCSAAHFTNPYAWSKMWSEHLVMKHGNAIGLRFHNIYGSGGSRGIVWYLMQQPDGAKITIRGPELVRDYIFIDDVVDTIIWHLRPSPGVFIDLDAVHANTPHGLKTDDVIKLAMEQNIYFGEEQYVKGLPKSFVFDVGTGIGTQTMDVVNLYQKLSGKTFDISIEEAGENEPKEMVSNRSVPNFITLEEGLNKMINA